MINDVITNGWKTLRALGESEGLEGNPYFLLRTLTPSYAEYVPYIVDWVTSHLPWCSYARAKMADGMEVDVASVLSAAEKDAEGKFKSIDVKKDIDPDLDVGNLLAIDLQPIDLRELRWV